MPFLERLDEHFGYLDDARRIALLRKAISNAVKPGDFVLDLGCGTGILGLFSLQAGAWHVVFVDETDMIDVARESMERSGYSDRCTFIEGYSHHVVLERQVDVVVSDNIGFFGVDYGVLETLKDAKDRFLAPGGKLLPARLRLKAALASFDGKVDALERWRNSAIPKEFHWLAELNSNFKLPMDVEPVSLISEPILLAEYLVGIDAPDYSRWQADTRITRDGAVDGIVGWFEADLTEDVPMTNAPSAPERVSRSAAFFPIEQPMTLSKDEIARISISARPRDSFWSWEVASSDGAHRCRQSTLNAVSKSNLQNTQLVKSQPLTLTPAAELRRVVLGYCDGTRSAQEVMELVLENHAGLMPTPEALQTGVTAILATSSGPGT